MKFQNTPQTKPFPYYVNFPSNFKQSLRCSTVAFLLFLASLCLYFSFYFAFYLYYYAELLLFIVCYNKKLFSLSQINKRIIKKPIQNRLSYRNAYKEPQHQIKSNSNNKIIQSHVTKRAREREGREE